MKQSSEENTKRSESSKRSQLDLLDLKTKFAKLLESQRLPFVITEELIRLLDDILYLYNQCSPDSDVIYTNCDNEECWIPHGKEVFDYLRDFFVDSYSTEKIFVIYITSNEMASSWAAVSEVGAGWITQSKHDIFNVHGYTPRSPLNIGLEWHTSEKEGNIIMMNNLESNKFVVKIIDICKDLGYKHRDKESNLIELKKLISLKP